MKTGKNFLSFLVLCCVPFTGWSQRADLTCTATAVPATVRSEGLAERMGDIVLNCSGSPGAAVKGNLTVFLTVNITNHITTSGSTDALLTINTGAGPVPSGIPGLLVSPSSIMFNGVSLTVPTTGKLDVVLTNIRGAATQAGAGAPIRAFLGYSNPTGLLLDTSQFVVARPQPGLLASESSSVIRCTGSPLPASIGLSSLFATGTRFASTRITEGFAAAFQKQQPYDDTGTRFLVRYTGLPGGVHLFVPDVIAGSSATEPTSAGDLGLAQAGGKYTPVLTGSLLLARVPDANERGVGGAPVIHARPAGFRHRHSRCCQ